MAEIPASEFEDYPSETGQVNEVPQDELVTKASDIGNFYGIPNETNYSPQREKDFNGFGGDIYRNSPAIAQKFYDSKSNEYEELNTSLGGKYSGEMLFGDSVRDAAVSFDIERSKDSEDKAKKFKKYYPDGEIQYIQRTSGEKILLGRKNADSQWSKLETIPTKIGSATGSLATAGAIAGEAIGAAYGGVAGGALGAGIGSVLGDIGDTAVEKKRGYSQKDSYAHPEQIPMALLSTGFSWWGKGGIVGAVSGKFLKEGAATARVKAAQEFAKQEGVPTLTRGQATTNPILSGIYKQAVTIDEPTRVQALDSANAATRKFIEMANKSSGELDQKSLSMLVDTARYNVGKAVSSLKSREVAPEDAGKALGDAFDNWELIVDGPNGYLSQLYKKAENESVDINWDVSNVQKRVKELRGGTQGQGKEIIKEVPSPVTGPDGNPLGTMVQKETPDVKLTEDPRGELASAMDAIESLSPILTRYTSKDGNTFSAFEQIKALRTRFRRLSYSDDPGIAGVAKQIHKELNNTLENGFHVNGDEAQAAVSTAAIKKANSEYRAFMELTDLRPIKNMQNMGAGDYARVVENIIQPGKSEAMKLIANVVPGGQDILRKVFTTRLFAGDRTSTWNDSITKELDRWAAANDTAGLSFLLKPGEKDLLLKYAKDRERLEGGFLAKIAGYDRDSSALAWETISKGKPEDLKHILELAGGLNTKQGMALRRGVLQRMYENSTANVPKFGDVFVYDKFKDEINIMRNRGTLDTLFDKKEIKFLENLDSYIDVVRVNVDMGSGLQAAQVASNVAQIPLKAAEQISEGNPEGAVKKMYKAFVLPISLKMAGHFLLNKPAGELASPSTGAVAKKSAVWLAAKAAASIAGQREGDKPLPNAASAQFVYPISLPTVGAFAR